MVPLAQGDGEALVDLAARTLAAHLTGQPLDGRAPETPALRAVGSSFVTLETGGHLRGCVGSLDASRPLYVDVRRNAIRATTDPRLPPVRVGDWPTLDVSVSVLSPLVPLAVADPGQLAAVLRTGVDGLVLTDGVRRATFLPAVWAKLPDPGQFVRALLRKGGWVDWPSGLRSLGYTVVEFHSRSPRTPLESGTMHS